MKAREDGKDVFDDIGWIGCGWLSFDVSVFILKAVLQTRQITVCTDCQLPCIGYCLVREETTFACKGGRGGVTECYNDS